MTGPAGVTLSLSKVGSKDVLKEVVSGNGGAYTFENVLPGEYEIIAKHPTFKFDTVSNTKCDLSVFSVRRKILAITGYNDVVTTVNL